MRAAGLAIHIITALAIVTVPAAAATATVPEATCTLEVYPSSTTVARGSGGAVALDTYIPGVPEDVAVVITGAPPGVAAKLDRDTFLCGQTRRMEFEIACTAVPGIYALKLTATTSEGSTSSTLTLTVA